MAMKKFCSTVTSAHFQGILSVATKWWQFSFSIKTNTLKTR